MTATPLPSGGARRAAYAEIARYAGDKAAVPVDLADNTNRWGMPPAAARVVRELGAEALTRYPDAYGGPLKRALGTYLDVPPESIVTGCGSDDVLDCAFRAFAEPGDRVAIAEPTFVMASTFARTNGLAPIAVPLTASYDVDAGAMLAAKPRIAYVCAPNNPTGTVASRAALERVTSDRGVVVLIDEAYAEFAGDSALDLARRDHVLVVRTMSKAFGLAGLRVGYAVGAPALVAEIEKARGPYKVNALAQAAAIAALDEDLAWVLQYVQRAIESRDRLTGALRERGLTVLDSAANFVFVAVAGAPRVAAAMRERGVAVRPFAGLPRISPELDASGGAGLRISAGPWPMMQQVLDALDAALAGTRA